MGARATFTRCWMWRARHGVKAITERFPMAKANEAIARVKKSKVRYRAGAGELRRD